VPANAASGSQPKKDAKTLQGGGKKSAEAAVAKTNATKPTNEDMDVSSDALASTSASGDSLEFSKLAAATSVPSSFSPVPNSWEEIYIFC